jgi:hypothetical protein
MVTFIFDFLSVFLFYNPFYQVGIGFFILVLCINCSYFYRNSRDEEKDYCIRKNLQIDEKGTCSSCGFFSSKEYLQKPILIVQR